MIKNVIIIKFTFKSSAWLNYQIKVGNHHFIYTVCLPQIGLLENKFLTVIGDLQLISVILLCARFESEIKILLAIYLKIKLLIILILIISWHIINNTMVISYLFLMILVISW